MRPVLINDLVTAARTLLAAPPQDRRQMIHQIVQHARFGDLYRKRVGRSHMRFGNGTLASACQTYAQAPMPARCDPQYLSCLALVISAMIGDS